MSELWPLYSIKKKVKSNKLPEHTTARVDPDSDGAGGVKAKQSAGLSLQWD